MNMMPPEVAASLLEVMHEEFPNEACGLVLDDWEILPVTNVHPAPKQNFKLNPMQQLAYVEEYGDRIIGVWHSHPSGDHTPSRADREFPYKDLRYWIATLDNVYEWRIEDDIATPINPLDGKPGNTNLAYPIFDAPIQVRPEFGQASESSQS